MEQPKIGLALGSGAARGIAHLGVLRVLKKYQVPIHCVAGTSIGALIGALYAAGLDVEFMIDFACQLQARNWVDLCLPRMGLITGDKVEAMLRLLSRQRKIEELAIPFAAVATDIERGEAVVLKTGEVARAVRASISIPGVFKPVTIGDRILVDGAVVDRVPVSVVREMGADLVIAVDVNKYVTQQPVKNIFDVIFQTLDIMERKILNSTILDTDILIRPKVGEFNAADFQKVEELVARGEEAAEAAISHIGWAMRRFAKDDDGVSYIGEV